MQVYFKLLETAHVCLNIFYISHASIFSPKWEWSARTVEPCCRWIKRSTLCECDSISCYTFFLVASFHACFGLFRLCRSWPRWRIRSSSWQQGRRIFPNFSWRHSSVSWPERVHSQCKVHHFPFLYTLLKTSRTSGFPLYYLLEHVFKFHQ